MKSTFSLTIDTDWVPQFVLDDMLILLRDHGIPATIFCTSVYTGLDDPLFEVALHPNFLPGSSHGQSEEECLSHVQSLYPHAVGMRSHCYYWHNKMFKLVAGKKLSYDSSLLTPLQPGLTPFRALGLTRFPVWYSDGVHMDSGRKFTRFDLPELNAAGLKVILFHPIHIYLNSYSLQDTATALSGLNLADCRPCDLLPYRKQGEGMRTLFTDLVHILKQEACVRLKELL